MKIVYRTPNLKTSLKARTTGKIKRKMTSAVNSLYDKKGMGLINTTQQNIKRDKVTQTKLTAPSTRSSDVIVEPLSQESPVKNKPNYIGMLISFLIALAALGLKNIIMAGFFFVLIYLFYKNETSQTKNTTTSEPKKKSKKERQSELKSLIARLENNIVRVSDHEKILNETLSVETFSDSLTTVFDIVHESYELILDARTLDPDSDMQHLQNELDLINSSKIQLEEEFVKRYFFENIKNANRLKTETEKLNNIATGKAKLLEKRRIFEPETMALIETVYR